MTGHVRWKLIKVMAISEYFILGLFVFLGFLSLLAACFNFEWFFSARKAVPVVRMMGRGGARIFYAFLGLALIGCAVMGWLSWS